MEEVRNQERHDLLVSYSSSLTFASSRTSHRVRVVLSLDFLCWLIDWQCTKIVQQTRYIIDVRPFGPRLDLAKGC